MDDERNGDARTIGLSETVDALVQAIIVWDRTSYRHGQRTSEYAAAIAREMGVGEEEAEQIRIGSLLHDIGKIGVDLSVLRKPGRFDQEEQQLVRLHPEMGASILERVLPHTIVECAAAHHEQPDGNGYPRGLRSGEIPRGAHICRVADVLDSLTTEQTYRAPHTLDEALAELRDGAGTRYDAATVEALIALIERRELPRAA